MFTRWQKRKRKSPASDDARKTDVQCTAIVVESAHIDAVHCVARQIALRRGGDKHFFQRLAAALVDREFDREIVQTEESHA